MSPVGRTELVSAILNQNGHGSKSRIPKVSHVLLLMTFIPQPPSIMVLVISLTLTITVIAGLLVSTTPDPSSGFEKNAGPGSRFDSVSVVLSPAVNRGTNFSRRPNGSKIWHTCNACQVGPSSVLFTGSSGCAFCSYISAILRSLAFLIHLVACFQIFSWVSHLVSFPLERVVTCWMSVISAMNIFTAGCFSFALIGHWLL